MLTKLKSFIRAVSDHWLGKSAVVITNAAFFTLIVLELLRISGILTNSYIGLVTYMTLPALFVLGLLLIPLGWWRLKKLTGLSNRELMQREFDPEFLKAREKGSNLMMTITVLTAVNVIFFGTISARMLHFMDSPVFCGTACHVMEPEWTTYQVSPHAHVACVNCHVGEGAGALINAKINGLYQVLSVSLNLYEQPIPTPVHQLRPARETCEKCHWPDKFYGKRLKTISHYVADSANTQTFTTLALKVGAADSKPGSGIHWHVSIGHEIVYQAADEKRKTIAWVEVRHLDGTIQRYENRNLNDADGLEHPETRTMDCVDCHNRATHIYEPMEAAIDKRMAQNLIPQDLPWVKKAALAALGNDYSERDAGLQGVYDYVGQWYRREHPDLSYRYSQEIEKAAAGIQAIYHRNIHPGMKIDWDAYPAHIGHAREDAGCFRCHNKDMLDENGQAVRYDCTLCHSILAWNTPSPLTFIEDADSSKANYQMHRYLQQEFIQSGHKRY